MFIKARITTLIRGLLMLFALGTISEIVASSDAFARAGGRRSAGRGYQKPAQPPAQRFNNPQAQPPSQRGSFMKGLAGGIAGGFLGSMLFSSMGHAAGAGGAGGGGLGFLEIALLAGAAFLLFRWWKNRQQMNLATAGQASGLGAAYPPAASQQAQSYASQPSLAGQGAFASSLNSAAVLSTDEASDIFFKVQGAWTRRNLQSVRSLLGDEIAASFQRDIDDLIRDKRINRLENISVRRIEAEETWQEMGADFVRMRIVANLLDYTVNEQNGQVLEGSDNDPVKFEEDWIFARNGGSSSWQLVGIQQIAS